MNHGVNSVRRYISGANKFSSICFLLFIIFSVLFRFVLPFGDEPDFIVRAPRFVLDTPDFISPYFLGINKNLDYLSLCHSHGNLLDFLSVIEFSTCSQDVYQVFLRLFNQFFLMVIPWLLLIFRDVFYIWLNDTVEVIDSKLDALSITFFTSSFIYYYGVLGWEQYLLLLSAFTFLFLSNLIFLSLLVLWIFSIDLGDSVIVIYSIFLSYVYKWTAKKYGFKYVTILSIFIILTALILGTTLVGFFEKISLLSSKAQAISAAYEYSDLRNKYPIYLRPVITYLTLVLYLPSGVKALCAIFVSSIGLAYIFVSSIKIRRNFCKESFCYLMTFITVIVSVVFILPGYANAKYYVFMLPMFYFFVLSVTRKENVLIMVTLINTICIVELVFSYLNY